MYPYRGRSGPLRSTPANVQCQKCLKRGHYSFECKAKPQERPYVSRPSRTQQLLNPALAPRLTSDVPEEFKKKKGVADQELAKKEAERQKSERPGGEDSGRPERRRSDSSTSVSTISTGSPSSLPSRRGSRSPSPMRDRSVSPEHKIALDHRHQSARPHSSSRESRAGRPNHRRQGSFGSHDRRPTPERRHSKGFDKRRSPTGRRSSSSSDHLRGRDRAVKRMRVSVSRSRSRSPRKESEGSSRQYRKRHDQGESAMRESEDRRFQSRAARNSPRQRSLSPFSKRLALTQAMNMGK
ncbi:hypothetical protein VTK73DRAFT_6719 [Phialemonium thermophilum]|uniref:Zinc knuckle-domain-containing protein n=1 Tax=Phialemonium thermophilum TaxID=223376 RepID=A0ABR3XWA9_9PEZI